MLIHNSEGNYSFLRGIAPYSGGVVADTGHEIIHVRFLQPVPLRAGFDRIRQHLENAHRPERALCGIELRSPKPFTFQGFNDFNQSYVTVLKDWGILTQGMNPVARTNIAPEIGAPSVPAIYGFSYTAPSATKRKTFVVAGGGELPEGSLKPEDVVRKGDTSAEGLREKTRFVMGLMSGRVQGLGVAWDQATTVNVYTVHSICHILASEIVNPIGAGSIHGVTWHYSRPPIVSIEYEMDLRGCDKELVL